MPQQVSPISCSVFAKMSSSSPALVVIDAGTDDIAENAGAYNEVRLEMWSMVELARANKIKVILTSVLPAAAFWLESFREGCPAKDNAAECQNPENMPENKILYVDCSEMVEGDNDCETARTTQMGTPHSRRV